MSAQPDRKEKSQPPLQGEQRTEVLYGAEDVVSRGVQFMKNVQKRMDICFDGKGPSIVIEVDAYRNGYADIRKRGARIRAFTEVTRDNVGYCRELMKIVDELRHLDGMKGGIAVSEGEYMATTVLQEAKPLAQAIYSNVPEAVEQGRYVFESMWSNAMPAEQRMREIEEGTVRPETRLVQVPDDILDKTMQMARDSSEYTTCSVSDGLLYAYNHIFDTVAHVLDKVRRGEHRGYRWVTEIKGREIAKIAKIFLDMGMEIRHIENLPPLSFGVSDKVIGTTLDRLEGGKLNQNALFSNDPVYIRHFRSIFEELWKNGIDARIKIREIEDGVEPEKTEVIYGLDSTVKALLQCFSLAAGRHDACGDSTLPQVLLTNEPVRQAYSELKKRNVRTRFITEITPSNIGYCKELGKIVDELRHLDGVKMTFGVNEKEYVAAAGPVETSSAPQLIRSNTKAVVEQQQYFFEALWNKAMPAGEKFREIEEGVEPEETEIIFGAENVVRKNLECFSRMPERIDACFDSTGPSVILSAPPILQAGADLVKRGGRIRMVTDITASNISHCKELMKYHELRHLEGIKGNFAVSEKDYFGYLISKESEPMTQAIYSNVRRFVEDQQYLFRTLWEKAIPAQDRIREIEEGVKPDIIETVRDPAEIQRRGLEMVKSAKSEILIIFSTANAFRRQDRGVGMIGLLMESQKNGVKIRIMTPADDHVQKVADRLKGQGLQKQIDIRFIEQPMRTTVTIVIADRASSMAVELKDDTKETSLEAVGFATYSNSKPTVLSYVSIFESLWSQSELYEHIRFLYEQLKAHDKLQKEFINIAAHELRTPIQPILGLAEILRDQLSPGDSQNGRMLDAIIRNARRLLQLQEDILDATRIESNQLRLDIKQFSLNQMLLQAIEDYKGQLDAGKIKMLFKFDGDIDITADRNRLIQVVSNLLSNAAKFTREGGVVSVGTERKGGQVIVRVRDTGAGIDPEVMPRLFGKFVTKSDKGTGLGLFISKSIVEAHGGRMWGENNPDSGGATFAFSLPVTR